MAHHPKKTASKDILLYGHHPVSLALQNKKRRILEIYCTKEAEHTLKIPSVIPVRRVDKTYLETLVGRDAVHQGVVARCLPVIQPDLSALLEQVVQQETAVLMILDQVTDPHNIGAILRSSVAFDATAVIVPENGTPEENGTLAKSASGALELIPYLRVGNLARVLDKLKEQGIWCIGLDGYAEQSIATTKLPKKCAFIMGSEGDGMRRLTQQNCDYCVKLPMNPAIESLNVSNAAALTLYEFRRQYPSR